jgi:hypothetical protein
MIIYSVADDLNFGGSPTPRLKIEMRDSLMAKKTKVNGSGGKGPLFAIGPRGLTTVEDSWGDS